MWWSWRSWVDEQISQGEPVATNMDRFLVACRRRKVKAAGLPPQLGRPAADSGSITISLPSGTSGGRLEGRGSYHSFGPPYISVASSPIYVKHIHPNVGCCSVGVYYGWMEEGYWLSNLRRIRRYRELSQAELARRVGISVAALALIEQGEREPRLSVALKIAEVLGVTIDELTGRKPPEHLLRE